MYSVFPCEFENGLRFLLRRLWKKFFFSIWPQNPGEAQTVKMGVDNAKKIIATKPLP